MDKNIPDIYNLLQEIAWCFGNHGINGECCGDLSLTEFIALRKVYENSNFSVQDIGNSINFTKSGATRIVNRLESKGYIVRERSPHDFRVCCVSVTAHGTEVIAKTMERYSAYLEEILKDLDSHAIVDIKDTLEVLVESVRKHKFI